MFADLIVWVVTLVVTVCFAVLVVGPVLVWLGAVVEMFRKPDNNKLGPM